MVSAMHEVACVLAGERSLLKSAMLVRFIGGSRWWSVLVGRRSLPQSAMLVRFVGGSRRCLFFLNYPAQNKDPCEHFCPQGFWFALC